MTTVEFPKVTLGHVVIGIEKLDTGKVVVYAYYGTNPMRDTRVEFPWNMNLHGHVLFLVQQVTEAADKAGAYAISYSSSVDFWEEAIA